MALENGFSIIFIIMNMNLKLDLKKKKKNLICSHPESHKSSEKVKIMAKSTVVRTKMSPPSYYAYLS